MILRTTAADKPFKLKSKLGETKRGRPINNRPSKN